MEPVFILIRSRLSAITQNFKSNLCATFQTVSSRPFSSRPFSSRPFSSRPHQVPSSSLHASSMGSSSGIFPLTEFASARMEWAPVSLDYTSDNSEKKASCLLSDAGDTLTIQDGKSDFEVPLLWLRDSCTCEKCVNHGSFQRNSWTVQDNAKLEQAEISGGNLIAKWTDGHLTKYSLKNIQKIFDQRRKLEIRSSGADNQKQVLWNSETWKTLSLPTITKTGILTETGLKQLLHNIHVFGFGLVSGCEPTETDTEAIIRRIAAPMPTTFSPGMWTFTSNMARGDTAYSNCYLAPHTDSTYFSNPCRIQVFHCLDREGCAGGDTILVDGTHCAEVLQEQDPAAMDLLSSVPQECVYMEPGVCYKWVDTVFKKARLDGTLQRVRFNMYDRSSRPPFCETEKMNSYYRALKKYADLTQSSTNQLMMQLSPGTIIMIDNWRVLHGRTEFFGKRVVNGCYLDNDEFNHASRKHGVIE